jgi:hypothetical protein
MTRTEFVEQFQHGVGALVRLPTPQARRALGQLEAFVAELAGHLRWARNVLAVREEEKTDETHR